MSREIKNTLFRFATMRAPKIIEAAAIDNNFVKHPHKIEESSSKFLKVIADLSSVSEKKAAILKAANTFARESLKTKMAVKGLVGAELYDFAIWLTANRKTLNVEEAVNFAKKAEGKLNAPTTVKVWDNVFYQIITYTSGPVRDALFSVLIADFYLKKINLKVDKTDEVHQKLAQSRIVIPKELFSRETILGDSKFKNTTQDTSLLDKELESIVLGEEIRYLNIIKKEVNLAKDIYTKYEAKIYNDAKVKHQEIIDATYAKTKFSE